ncbi:hypothetical protein AO378_0538 [Moraxella catarrhalis]|nr:hypothetical protein AO378_0538 [Moraxella catarrhalis]
MKSRKEGRNTSHFMLKIKVLKKPNKRMMRQALINALS